MRIVFLGTPDFAVPPLQALHRAGQEIVAVVTQPDRRRNRGHMQPTPVKACAMDLGLPVLSPEKIKSPEAIAALSALQPDLFVVVAYGQILSRAVLDIPRRGSINIHASLLPKYRGAAPIHWAVIHGEQETGVSIMYLDEGMDTGPVVATARTPIGAEDTTEELFARLSTLGAELLLEVVQQMEQGEVQAVPQDAALASYAPLLSRDIERIDWSMDAAALHNLIRGLNSWPGCHTYFRGKRLKLWESRLLEGESKAAPGTVVHCDNRGLTMACGSGLLLLTRVQPEGKAQMDAASFIRGYHVQPGELLGSDA